MKTIAAALFVVTGLTAGVGSASAQVDEPLVIITHPDSPVDTMTLAEARDIFLGRSSRLDDEPVALIENAGERERFYEELLSMSLNRLKRHWISLVLSGKNVVPPKTVDARDVLGEVARVRRSLSFVTLSAVDPSVKVLALDGFRPGEPGYPLH